MNTPIKASGTFLMARPQILTASGPGLGSLMIWCPQPTSNQVAEERFNLDALSGRRIHQPISTATIIGRS